MGLSEPDHAAATPILSIDGLHPTGHGPRVAAVRVSGEVDAAGRVALARHQADVMLIPTGKRKGRNPSLASIYRALAEHEKRRAYPEAVEQARTDFAVLQAST